MFSQEPHCTYRKSPLADVICQLRYPEILMIAAQSPAAFQGGRPAHLSQI